MTAIFHFRLFVFKGYCLALDIQIISNTNGNYIKTIPLDSFITDGRDDFYNQQLLPSEEDVGLVTN
jgi:hypothetical protein